MLVRTAPAAFHQMPAGGVVDCARKTLQWEGVTGLYKGVAAPLAGQMFFRATLFSALGSSKRWLSTDADGNRRGLTMLDCYKAGAMAGGAAAFFEGPIDFYKSQVHMPDCICLMTPLARPDLPPGSGKNKLGPPTAP